MLKKFVGLLLPGERGYVIICTGVLWRIWHIE